MNTKILEKCVQELKGDSPKIEYVLGMLETLIELNQVAPYEKTIPKNLPIAVQEGTDSESTPAFLRVA